MGIQYYLEVSRIKRKNGVKSVRIVKNVTDFHGNFNSLTDEIPERLYF